MNLTKLAAKAGCTFSREWDKASQQWLYWIRDERG